MQMSKEMIGLTKNQRLNFDDNGVRTSSWDGLDQTSYTTIETGFQKFYTRSRLDIRPAVSEKVTVKINEKEGFVIRPEEHVSDLHADDKGILEVCQFKHFNHGFADIAHIIKTPEKERSLLHHSYLRRWTNGLNNCDNIVTEHHGQCNAFTLQLRSEEHTSELQSLG